VRRVSGGGRETGLLGGGGLTGSPMRTACPVGSSMRSEPLSSSASSLVAVPSSTGRNAVTLISSAEGIVGRGERSGLLGSASAPRRGPARGGPERAGLFGSVPAPMERVLGLGTRAAGCDGTPDGSALRSFPSLTGCAESYRTLKKCAFKSRAIRPCARAEVPVAFPSRDRRPRRWITTAGDEPRGGWRPGRGRAREALQGITRRRPGPRQSFARELLPRE